jgi:PAS domain-containing protein
MPRMAQRDISLILMRQLASGLAVPTFIVDAAGDMLFFNEPAELLLGQRFDEVGEVLGPDRARVFAVREEDGQPVTDDREPLNVAMHERRAVHRRVIVRGLDGIDRNVEVMTFPLLGAGGGVIGAVAMFWERRAQ